MIFDGWQRLGILLTALWIFLVLCLVGAELLGTPIFHEFYFLSFKPLQSTEEIKKIPRFIQVSTSLSIGRVLFAVILMPLAAWSLIYAAIAVLRWIQIGFGINKRP